MNLAPIRYARIHVQYGGPVEKVLFRERDGFYEASVWLKRDLVPDRFRNLPNRFYGDCHGTGTSPYKRVAIYKAISEALERWAFWECLQRDDPACRLDLSTTGFSAFPGFFARSARENSYQEAVERWSLFQWWKEILPSRRVNKYILQILSPFSKSRIMVVWQDLANGFRAYGFAAHRKADAAVSKASEELRRNARILSTRTEDGVSAITNTERRLLYFASRDGQKKFDEKILATSQLLVPSKSPQLGFDDVVIGPWSRFAHVWRCFIPLPYEKIDATRDDLFLF